MKLLVVFGTRPEAVKLAPIIAVLKAERTVETQACFTGQHRELVESTLDFFEIRPDFNLGLMTPGQPLNRQLYT
jgi:UDP-N-acetylglucosamine 2-epimerase